jgi:hypothetical protein
MAELTRRYIVMPMSTEGPFDLQDPDAPFVLKPWKDPAALSALIAYRDRCYPELAQELTTWISAIRSGPTVRGSVGARNESHLATRRRPAARASQRPPVKARPKRGVAKASGRQRKKKH